MSSSSSALAAVASAGPISSASAGPSSAPASAQEQLRAKLREILGESPGDVDTVASQVFGFLREKSDSYQSTHLSDQWSCRLVKRANKPDLVTLVVFSSEGKRPSIDTTIFPFVHKIRVTSETVVESQKSWKLTQLEENHPKGKEYLEQLKHGREVYESCGQDKPDGSKVNKPNLVVSEDPPEILQRANQCPFSAWLNQQDKKELSTKNRFSDLLQMVAQLADALDALHSKGIIHGGVDSSAFFVDCIVNEEEVLYTNPRIGNLSHASRTSEYRGNHQPEAQTRMLADQQQLLQLLDKKWYDKSIPPKLKSTYDSESITPAYEAMMKLIGDVKSANDPVKKLGDQLRKIAGQCSLVNSE